MEWKMIRRLLLLVSWIPIQLAFPGRVLGLTEDVYTSYNQPVASIVAPFDVTDSRATFLQVVNLAGLSPFGDGFLAGVTTHWVFWDESGAFLADVDICLLLSDNVLVDPSSVRSIDAGNNPVGPTFDLSGHRGIVVVTTYATDEICSPGITRGTIPVSSAIVGNYLIYNIDTGEVLQSAAVGFDLDFFGEFVELPTFSLDRLDLYAASEDVLLDSSVILFSVEQQRGVGPYAGIEIGPSAVPISGTVDFLDNEASSSAAAGNDVARTASATPFSFLGALFRSLTGPSGRGFFPSGSLSGRAGTLRVSSLLRGDRPLGNGTFVYGIHGQTTGSRSLTAAAKGLTVAPGGSLSRTVYKGVNPDPFFARAGGNQARSEDTARRMSAPRTGVSPPLGDSRRRRLIIDPQWASSAEEKRAASRTSAAAATPVSLGLIENPSSVASGIGQFSGWICDAPAGAEIVVDGASPIPVAYGSPRVDTAGVCGDSDNGFSLLYNFNLFGDGDHVAVLRDRATGREINRTSFRVTTLGQNFVTGAAGSCTMQIIGRQAQFDWDQGSQGFVLTRVQ